MEKMGKNSQNSGYILEVIIKMIVYSLTSICDVNFYIMFIILIDSCQKAKENHIKSTEIIEWIVKRISVNKVFLRYYLSHVTNITLHNHFLTPLQQGGLINT